MYKKYLLIAAIALGFWGGAPANAQVKPITDIEVTDANNNLLGQVFLLPDFGLGESSVIMKVNSQFVLLPFSARGFGETSDYLAFNTTDCTGPAWLLTNDIPTLFARSAIVMPGNTLYISVAGASVVEQTIGSLQRKFDPIFDPTPNGCFTSTGTTTVIAARLVTNLDTIFQPPFKLRGRALKKH